jgi:hypothetical protein
MTDESMTVREAAKGYEREFVVRVVDGAERGGLEIREPGNPETRIFSTEHWEVKP